MNQIVPFGQAGLPAHLQGRQIRGTLTAATEGVSAGGHPRLLYRGKVWRFKSENGDETPLRTGVINAVIVGANAALSKTFYAGPYNPDAAEAPDCYSNDGITPEANSKAIQSDKCASCRWNAWGSSPQGTQGKACQDNKRLAVVVLEDPSSTVRELRIPPASLKPFRLACQKLMDSGQQVDLEMVVCEMSFNLDATHPQIEFQWVGYAPEVITQIVDRLSESELDRMLGRKKAPLALAGPARDDTATDLKKPGLAQVGPTPEEVAAKQQAQYQSERNDGMEKTELPTYLQKKPEPVKADPAPKPRTRAARATPVVAEPEETSSEIDDIIAGILG